MPDLLRAQDTDEGIPSSSHRTARISLAQKGARSRIWARAGKDARHVLTRLASRPSVWPTELRAPLPLAHGHASCAQVVAGLAYGEFAEVEDRGGQHGVGAAGDHALVEVFQGAHAA